MSGTKQFDGFDHSRKAHYMLRRGLLLSKAEAIIDETIEFCKSSCIAEVVWKCDAEAFNHGITTIALVREYVKVLELAARKLDRAGLIHSINPWLTLNWSDRGRRQRELYPDFDWRVDIDGNQAAACPCLRSEAWREHLAETYRLYATTKPNIIWLEDDFKTFLDGGGCFCQQCLSAFSGQIGEDFDRQGLLKRILAPGKPDPLRVKWIDFLAAEMVETCRRLERAVHMECPHTHLGLMGSWSSDGRWWREALEALAGPLQPVFRSSLSPYEENRAIEFMPDNFDIVKETICAGPGVRNCPELENSTYTPFSKSVRMTRLQMGLSQMLGNSDITMNLFDMVGTPISEDIRIGRMLRETKPLLDAMASANGPGATQRGVGIIWDKRMADHILLREGEGIDGFRTDGKGWAAPLQGAGMPVIWEKSTVNAVTGRILYALSDAEIRRLLGCGLLLDGSAAATLTEMGYGEYLGVTPVEKVRRYDVLLSAEEYCNSDFGGRQKCYLDVRRYSEQMYLYRLERADRAVEISRYVDPDERAVMSAMTAFENSLGGRVVVHAFDLSGQISSSFMNWTRKRQLVSCIRWLGRGRVDLVVNGGAWMVPIRRDYEHYTLLGVLNFETDNWDYVELTLSWDGPKPDRIAMACDREGWNEIRPDKLSLNEGELFIRLDCSLRAMDFLALAVFPS